MDAAAELVSLAQRLGIAKPATEAQIASFVKKLKFAPPVDYLAYLRLSNGNHGAKLGPAAEPPFLDFYSTQESLVRTKEYRFPEKAPGVFIIGTDGSDGAYCLDGRYSPPRFIITSYLSPGGPHGSADYGESFVKFAQALLKDPPDPGVTPLPPQTAVHDGGKVEVIPLPEELTCADETYGRVSRVSNVCLSSDHQTFFSYRRDMQTLIECSFPEAKVLRITPCALQVDDFNSVCVRHVDGTSVVLCGSVFGKSGVWIINRADGKVLHHGTERFVTTMAHDALLTSDIDDWQQLSKPLTYRVLERSTGKLLRSFVSGLNTTISADGKWMVSKNAEDREVELRELPGGQVRWKIVVPPNDKPHFPHARFAFAPDCTKLLVQIAYEKPLPVEEEPPPNTFQYLVKKTRRNRPHPETVIHVVALDMLNGKMLAKTVVKPSIYADPPAWLPDSRGWVQYQVKGRLAVFHPQTGKVQAKCPQESYTSEISPIPDGRAMCVFHGSKLMIWTPP